MQDMKKDQGENDTKLNPLEIEIRAESEKYAPIFKSKLKVRILMLLLIYPELSLSQISQKLGKAKSTIN